MKISQMLLRENFYEINRNTLSEYFKNSDKFSMLYVYPQLNAIITANPSKKVKDYLLNEYSIKGNPIKALLVKCYVKVCLSSRGLFAAKKIRIKNNMTDDMLIYPCNKKYRIFDFSAGSVDVIAKSGFPKNDLLREIEFRSQNKEEFIPELITSHQSGYSERIIDGMSLARLGGDFKKYFSHALETLNNYSERIGETKNISAKEYASELVSKINEILVNTSKNIDKTLILNIADEVKGAILEEKVIKLMLSHGDLQPGNIWVEKSGKMYIIDWESWDVRSEWYDSVILYHNIRNGGINEYINKCGDVIETSIVILEDLIYKLKELVNLPGNYGEKEMCHYLDILQHK